MPAWLDRLLRQRSSPEPEAISAEDADLEAFFTDVEHLRSVFHEFVTAPSLPKRLLVIHGVGGVGKTTLLRMYRLYCKRQAIPVALISGDEAKTPVDVLRGLTGDLAQDGIELSSLQRTLEQYRAIQAKVEREGAKIGATAAKAGAKAAMGVAAGYIPVVGPVVAAFAGAGTEAFVDWLRGFLSKPDVELYLDPAARLTQDFVNDLAPVATKRRLVLMLDTYEQMTVIDNWVRDLVRQVPANVLVVIAGREWPDQDWDRAWPGWMTNARIEALEAMDEDDMRTLVQRYYATMRGDAPDPAQVEEIVRFARGLPLVVTSAVRLWVRYGVQDFQAVKPQVVADLVDRLMEGTPDEMRPALEAAATLRWFNKETLRVLLPAEQVEQVYDELRRFPFVRSRAEGLALHIVVREMLDENLKAHDPERHRTLHEEAATYFEAQVAQATGDERALCTLELMYHRVRADEEAGIRLFQERAEEFVPYHWDNRLRALLNDVNTYPLEQENSHLWRKYYNARLAYHETRLADAEKVYQAVCENEGAEPKLRAYALCDWGAVLSRRERIGQPGGIEKAISTVERSLKLVPLDAHLARGFFYLARVERYQARWDEEASFLEKAKVFFEQRGDEYGLAYAYVEIRRGSAKRGLWKELFIIQEQLEGLYGRLPESAALKSKVFGGWAWGWALAGRLSESEQKVRDSISLVRSLDDPFFLLSLLRDLGWTLGHQGRYSEADQSLSESLEIARGLEDPYDVGYALGFLGAILARQGDSRRATEYLLQSLEVKERLRDEHGILDLLVWLGKGQEIQQDLNKAQEYYRRCSDWKWCGRYYFDSEALCGLVRVKHTQGDYSAIWPLLAEAEALAHLYEYNDHLASLRLTQGHIAWEGCIPEWGSGFDAALHYYQQALTYALRYNRFLLDEVLWGGGVATPLRPIIPFCAERGEEGYRMLGALRDWWQSSVNDVGTPRLDTISPIPESISLLEAERIARKREPGDGSPQEDVVVRIERVFRELIAA